MYEFGYCCAKARCRLRRNNKECINDFFRKRGVYIGGNTNICTNILTTESYLISIGNNVTIAYDVKLITHDNSISKVLPNTTDLFGRVIIGDNCFIGAGSIILYGVELSDNIIVAAGSVVTKSFKESNIIIGGNPATVIGKWDGFGEKSKRKAINIKLMNSEEKKNAILKDSQLVRR